MTFHQEKQYDTGIELEICTISETFLKVVITW